MADRMNENVIEWFDGEDIAHVTYSNRYAGRIKRLAEKHPDEVKIIAANKDGSVLAHVPLKWVSVRRPRQVNMTDEQKKAFVERTRNSKLSTVQRENDSNFDFYAEGGEILDEEI